jgi:ribonuclease HI
MEKFTMNTDGGARGNPGPGAIGIVLRNSQADIILELGKFLGTCTNNEAEYLALVEGLTAASDKGIAILECRLDSELVVKQLTGLYKVKEPRMKVLYDIVKDLEQKFTNVTYKHVPRTLNKEADKLVNQVLDSAAKA